MQIISIRKVGYRRAMCLTCSAEKVYDPDQVSSASRWARNHVRKNPDHVAVVDVEHTTVFRANE